jgi:GNAT superfamily N-acetyltransferase
MELTTRIPGFTIRMATVQDVSLILEFIKMMALYEKLSHELVATQESLQKYLFSDPPAAEVIIGEYENHPVAFALFFQNFSTFMGKPGLYLEDIFVLEKMRGRGFGRVMLTYLAKLATERKYGRFEWVVLDWNTPAIEFYKALGAEIKKEWWINRLTGKALENLACEF